MTNGQALTLPPDARVTLITLGRASLSWEPKGRPPAVLLGPGKPLALITYLAFSPRRTASRDYLVNLLWANSDPDRAVHAMRQTVWQVRHLLGRGVLSNTPSGLTLELGLVSDRDAFLAAVEEGDEERAVALYTGGFLPDFAAPGGAEFEHWADLERGRLRTAFLRSTESVVRRFLATGRVREAQQLARRGRDIDLSNEGAWRLLLEALEAGNDWTAAAMEADALARLLDGLEREPEPATRAAIRRARQAPDDASATPRSALVAELVGREREFATILAAWGEVKQGCAHHVHVTATAGLGKTRLLQDIHARLRAAGARTVYVRAHAGERGIAYTFAGDLAGALAALPGAAGVSPGVASALVSLNPSLSSQYSAPAHSAKDHEVLRHRSVALTELLAAVADEGPIALLVDDLHWADNESRLLLAALSARLQGNRVLLVTTARPMTERIFEGTPTMLSLAPLDERQVTALVTSIAALPDESWARELPGRLAWATGGSPLLLLESLQLGLERGAWYSQETRGFHRILLPSPAPWEQAAHFGVGWKSWTPWRGGSFSRLLSRGRHSQWVPWRARQGDPRKRLSPPSPRWKNVGWYPGWGSCGRRSTTSWPHSRSTLLRLTCCAMRGRRWGGRLPKTSTRIRPWPVMLRHCSMPRGTKEGWRICSVVGSPSREAVATIASRGRSQGICWEFLRARRAFGGWSRPFPGTFACGWIPLA